LDALVLTGHVMSLNNVRQVARDGRKVYIDPQVYEALIETRKAIYAMAEKECPIYGFTVGVGWNKDVKVCKTFFEEYNTNLVYAHCVGISPYISDEETRAVMLTRLNTLLANTTGVAPELAKMYADMLNAGIHPLLPERGSVGQADVGCNAFIGLAMIGEGQVRYNGSTMPAGEALRQAGLRPIVLGPKDGLCIVANNGLAAGQGAVTLYELKEFMLMADIVYSMSLEGLGGNTSPLLPGTHKVRPYRFQVETARRITQMIEGSYIYRPTPGKALQDPLSFRGVAQIHGSAWHAIDYTEQLLGIQLNSTDDNPCYLPELENFFSCANYEPLVWVLGFEMLAVALSHVSKSSCLRTIKLSDPDFSGLSRFLTPNPSTICFSTLQKTFAALDSEIRHLSNPSSVDGLPIAGDIEDRHTNAPYAVQRVRKILDTLRYIFAIEMMHAAQALDYRKGLPLGKVTGEAFALVREHLSFYDKDRPITPDIEAAYALIKSRKLLELLE